MLFARPREGRGTRGEKEVLLMLLQETSLLDSERDSKINISQSYKFGGSSRKSCFLFFFFKGGKKKSSHSSSIRIFKATCLPLKAHPVFCFLAGGGKEKTKLTGIRKLQPKVNKNSVCFSICMR